MEIQRLLDSLFRPVSSKCFSKSSHKVFRIFFFSSGNKVSFYLRKEGLKASSYSALNISSQFHQLPTIKLLQKKKKKFFLESLRTYKSHPLEWLLSKRREITSIGEDEKGNHNALLVGTKIGTAAMENSMATPQKIKSRTPM